MAATTIMTLRIDPQLLAALRRRAKREGRSVSAEVVRMIRREVEPALPARRKPLRTMGMFADFEAPEFEEFKRLRRRFSAALRSTARGVRRSA